MCFEHLGLTSNRELITSMQTTKKTPILRLIKFYETSWEYQTVTRNSQFKKKSADFVFERYVIHPAWSVIEAFSSTIL